MAGIGVIEKTAIAIIDPMNPFLIEQTSSSTPAVSEYLRSQNIGRAYVMV